MNFYMEFLLLAILIISFTAFIAIVTNAFGHLLFKKKKNTYLKPLHNSQQNWKTLEKDSI
ncbi:hypothetical protein [Bacillus sp. Cs-700]|uniref:hypothetical protein n=1 Tax=Bacillus sp. Cs-700 TaxID=2589818 RepID=UPI0014094F95|nr:hypothetical protein [Bacillus sp. Cs-700]